MKQNKSRFMPLIMAVCVVVVMHVVVCMYMHVVVLVFAHGSPLSFPVRARPALSFNHTRFCEMNKPLWGMMQRLGAADTDPAVHHLVLHS